MNNIQFDFNPIVPVPSGSGGFPWRPILIGAGILIAIIVAYKYLKNEPPAEDETPPVSDNVEELPS